MANARIDIVSPAEAALLTDLYNQVFKPPRDTAFFERRFRGRYNALVLVASLDEQPVGFFVGFELKPNVYFLWLFGVLPAFRRQGIASQLAEAAHAWIADQGYEAVRLECHNQHRAMLHMALARGFDIVGIRWDPDRHANLVIFEKNVAGE